MEPLKVESTTLVICPEGYDFVRNGVVQGGHLISNGLSWVSLALCCGDRTDNAGRILPGSTYSPRHEIDGYVIRRKPEPVGECESLGDKLAECKKELETHKAALKYQQEGHRAALARVATLEFQLREAAHDRDEYGGQSIKYMKALSAAGHIMNEAMGLKVTT